MKKCVYCGFENEDEAMFCGGCGHKFEEDQESITNDELDNDPVENEKEIDDNSNLSEVESTEKVEQTVDLKKEHVKIPTLPCDDECEEVKEIPQSKKSNKGIIAAVIICIVVVCGAGGGFFFYQNNKHQAEIAALKAEQEEKDKESKKEMAEIKKAKKEAEKEAKKAREESQSNKSENTNDSSSSSSDKSDYPSTGTYVANYNMKERDGASLSASQVGHIKENDVLTIVDVVKNDDGSYWGKLSNGHYVCIKDSQYNYLSLS